MTIHSDHPFVPPEGERDGLRRLRGRLSAPVTIVATDAERGRVGLTVSSLVVVHGEPARLLLVLDPDSGLAEALRPGGSAAVSLLEPGDEFLAEVFAGLAPAPGGTFTVGDWTDSPWGPHLRGRSWCGARIDETRPLGWSVEVLATVEEVRIDGPGGLTHARGRYRAP